MNILCKTCCKWVDCTRSDNKPDGFCLDRDLFTHTAEERNCTDYAEGKPLTEKEWEDFQYAESV